MEDSKQKSLKIAWAIPFPSKGSGGYRTVLRRAKYFRDTYGATCDMFLVPEPGKGFDEGKLRKSFHDWFEYDAQGIYMEPIIQNEYDCIVATDYRTADYVAIQEIPHKFYLIQDYEPFFFRNSPINDSVKIAERSYELGLIPIPLGRWLANMFSEVDGKIYFSEFGADDKIYHSLQTEKEDAICAIYQPDKIRREPELLEKTLGVIAKENPNLKIYTYGAPSGPDLSEFTKNHFHLGIIPPVELRDLYNKCKVGICLSSTNPSRIPFEMMACGLPVIEMKGENTIHDIPDGKGAVLAEPNPESISSSVLKLISNDSKLAEMSNAATKTMEGRTLDKENEGFANAVIQTIGAQASEKVNIAKNPITPDEKQSLINLYKKIINTPIMKGSSIEIELTINDRASENLKVDCAIWHEPDQSDLQWIQGKKNEQVWKFKAKLRSCSDANWRTLYLHFYDFSKGEKFPNFLFPQDFPYEYKRFNFASTIYEDTIQKDSMEASIKVKVR